MLNDTVVASELGIKVEQQVLKPLPVGIQTFRDLIRGGYLYVDKTRLIYELIRYPKGVYFFARPRRFGKSLLISTLDAVFRGDKDLFDKLFLARSDYDWAEYPVIRIDFSRQSVRSAAQLEQVIEFFVKGIAESYDIALQGFDYQSYFDNLILQLARKNQVVILIDEYDKPIIDNITDVEEAARIRDVLKRFYSVIKAMDEHIRFVFLTGISRFSRVGVFSGLNNLRDISLDDAFAALPGITQAELERDFAEYIQSYAAEEGLSVAEVTAQIRYWYNGFRFSGKGEAVYNPFSLLLFFSAKRFSNFWFETGTPTFLINLIRTKEYDLTQIGERRLNETAFSTFEVENLQITPLLLQTGYLTIKSYDPATRLYTLNYPNFEVEDAFLTHLLGNYTPVETAATTDYLWQLIDALRTHDLETFFDVLKIFFAEIDYTLQIKQEKYYQTIFYLIFKLMGHRINVEVATDRGRIDAVIELDDAVYLFEFKLNGSAQAALDQIRQREYYVRYMKNGKAIHLVGVNFETASHGVSEWLVETIV